MSAIYDNWERLVAAALKKQEIWELFHRNSRCSSISQASDLSSSSSISRSPLDESFSLERSTRKKCYMLSARDLIIVWSDTLKYWRWVSHPNSRFPEVAELLIVCWLEVRGMISSKMLSPGTNYAAYLVFACRPGLYGFRYNPAEAFVAMGGCKGEKRKVYLDPEAVQHQVYQNVDSEPSAEHPKKRSDGWMEVELGEFFVEGDDDLEFHLMQTGSWKRGLIVHGIEIRPKEKGQGRK